MVFWGVEVKPGKPYTHSADLDELVEGSTLHLSQATLGLEGKSKERIVVKCQVGDGPELLLCSLIPGVSESCSLDLLFDQDVTFSVLGSTSVHLIGYYMPLEDDEMEDEDYADLSSEDDSDDDDSDDDDDDILMDDEAELVPPSSVKIEEINDEETPGKLLKGKEEVPISESKSAQKKRKKAEAQAAKVKADQEAKKVESPGKPAAASGDDSEDEDGFAKETPNKKQAVEGPDGAAAAAAPDSGKKKKNKKKNKKEQQTPGSTSPAVTSGSAITVSSPAGTTPAATPEPAKASEKQGKKAKAKENGVEKTPGTNGTTPAADKKSAKKESPVARKFPNGLEIHEVSMGKPDAKQAQPGKRIGMIYTGRLKSNGKVFDSNVGKKPFEFRLGVGEVIKGWDVGVNGMRVGDKRKLIIPPGMGYGAKGAPGSIPGNATLEFDVELVHVK